MALSWKFRVIQKLREQLGGSIEEMSLEEIQAQRRSHLPELPFGNELLERFGQTLFGVPRRGVNISDTVIGGAVGELAARVYTPVDAPGPRPLLVYYHGGGWVIGSPKQYDWYCSAMAEDLDAVVVSVDYRKAPEDPAPAAYDDAVASFRWLSEHRGQLATEGPIAVAGDSAGGNLSALVAIAARDEGLRLDGQVLIYPGVDLTMSFPSIHEMPNAPILPRSDIDAFRAHYLSGGVAPDDPRVSPYFVEDLTNVAPALVQTAEFDPLVDEGDAYAQRLEDAKVEVRHTRYVDQPHGFMSLPGVTPAARQAQSEAVAFLRSRFDRAVIA